MLHTNMIRTSIVLPPVLHQQLSVLARQEGKKLSEYLREQLGQIVTQEKKSHLDEMYNAISSMVGIGDPSITDASTTIDEVLYGEKGAWRGEPSDQGLWTLLKTKRNQ